MPCIPGQSNLFCAVVFYLEHVKLKMEGKFYADNNGEFSKL